MIHIVLTFVVQTVLASAAQSKHGPLRKLFISLYFSKVLNCLFPFALNRGTTNISENKTCDDAGPSYREKKKNMTAALVLPF